jgi:cob(I)alamin adenosyltransferase
MVQRIYTGTGDRGETGLFGGGRVPKSHPRVEAYGSVDELNAVIGWALTQIGEPTLGERLARVQPDLFSVGAHLATARREKGGGPVLPPLPADRIPELERWIDEAEADLPELRAFIMPGGSPGGAALHVARTVCRRAERAIVALAADDDVDRVIIIYLNRLSDLLFVWARRENAHAGAAERQWLPGSSG